MDGLAADLFERHGRSVRAYLRALTGNVELGDDLAQDVFLRVVGSAQRYEPRGRERAWIFRIARTTLIDHQRRMAARPVIADVVADPVAPPAQEVHLDLQRALAQLPETEREAFLMAEAGGLSYAEIALALEVTVPAVRSSLYRACMTLRAALLPPPPLAPMLVKDTSHDD